MLPNHLERAFDYAVPGNMQLAQGDVVQVNFNHRPLTGIVWGKGNSTTELSKLKPIADKLEHVPPMQPHMREFIEWVAWYTYSPIGSVLKMALPVQLTTTRSSPRRGGVRRGALREESSQLRNPSAIAKAMADKNPPPHGEGMAILEPDQQKAANQLQSQLDKGFRVTLIDGVTGSGKTEVYFTAVAKALEMGQQALILLPEIALSIQWLDRFVERFGFMPEVWHSNISPAKKRESYLRLARGEAGVVVGARSALFLPCKQLGLIVVDEEHDASYKQEDGVIYHARDMAVMRAKIENIPIFLASATPSLETWYNVQQQKYQHVVMPKRYAQASLPESQLIDLRRDIPERGQFLSTTLRRAMADTLAKTEQSLLFLNRRGYAPLMLCRTCGHRFECHACSAWLVLHKGAKKLSCHHCGKEEPIPTHCPTCKADDSLHACGPGVERIVEEVQQFLPQARVRCLSSDENMHQSLSDVIHAMQNGEIDVLVGTQMVAKGHHFEKLSLVGVVDADLGLAGGDLRAMERTFQLLHQIAGRAGRATTQGKAWVQTFSPEHPALQALISGDRERFMQQELQMRKHGHMPPFTRLLAVILEGQHEHEVANAARHMAGHFPTLDKARLFGPSPAPLYRLRHWYRWRMLVVAERNTELQSLAREWESRLKLPRNIKCKFDIDPYGFL